MNTLARQSRQAAVSLPQASDKDARVAYWCLIFLTFIMYVAPMGFFPVLIPLHLALVAAVISVLGYIAAVFAHGLRWSVWAPEVKLILWLAIFAIVSIPFSKWPGGSYEVFFDIYMKAIIVFFLIA